MRPFPGSVSRIARRLLGCAPGGPARTLFVIGVGAALSVATGAHAQSVVVFAGGQYDTSGVGYAGATLALPGSQISHGPAVRISGFGGGYQYQDNSQRIDATFAGAEVDGIYQFSLNDLWLNVGVGARFMNTRLSPASRSNRRRGDQVELVLGLDGGKAAGPWRADWYGAYGSRLDDYQARVSLTHALGAIVRAGAEFSAEGDPTYNTQLIGPYAAFTVGKTSEIQASVGYSQRSFRGSGVYARMGFNSTF
jgi:hypothetical protein